MVPESYKKWFLTIAGTIKLGGTWQTNYATYERTGPVELTLRNFKGTANEFQTHRYIKDSVAKECGWMILDENIADYIVIFPDGTKAPEDSQEELDSFNRMAGEGRENGEEAQGDGAGCPWDNA